MQQALIVDDSKTARLVLSKMLRRQGITVAAVESAEDALSFLNENNPDVIFMDHMMPGMDGFEAVKAIKADPSKSAIPIIMHTTKQGDIYLGQARALGAVDILTKPASDQALIEVFDRLQQLPQSAEAPPTTVAGMVDITAVAGDVARTIEMPAVAMPESNNRLNIEPPSYSFWGFKRQWILSSVWLAAILWLLYLYLPTEARLQRQAQQQQALVSTLEWAVNRKLIAYDYGEPPLAGERLALLQALVSQLKSAGFQGVIQVDGHIGEFCLVQVAYEGGGEISMLPSPELLVSSCSVIGSSASVAMQQSVEQSNDFQQFVSSQGLMLAEAELRLEIRAYGASQPLYPYPEGLGGVSSGDWNAVALNNNRIYIALIPSE